MKRIAIVSFTIEKGRLFLYQRYLLEEIKKISERVILVVNQEMYTELENNISGGIEIYTSQKVFDVSMWKEILLKLHSIDEIKEFDEVILLNDSFFGPLYPFEEIFEKMDTKEIDFWGITVHGRIPFQNEDKNAVVDDWPRFLQRYFMVFHRCVLENTEFWNFWQKLPEFNVYIETETEFEYILTDRLAKMGYRWSAYCDTQNWESSESKKFMSFLLFSPYKMLREKHLPVISRQMLYVPREIELCYHCGDETNRVIRYIEENTQYNLDYLYEYLIEKLNIYDVWEKLNASYVLPVERIGDSVYHEEKKVVVVAHLYYEDLFQFSVNYLKNLPEGIDVLITTSSEQKAEVLRNICNKELNNKYDVVKVEGRGREWSALLLGIKERLYCYDYFCFIHDKKSKQMYYSSVGESFNIFLWENMLGTKGYIENILELLGKNDRLGIVVPPVVYHGEFWGHSTDFWTACYENTKELAGKLRLQHIPDKSKPVLTIGSAFWSKVSALKVLLEYPFCLEEFPEEPMAIDGTMNHSLERILSFVAQDAGYYTGIIMNERYSCCEITNMRSMQQKVLRELKRKHEIDITSSFSTVETLRKRSDEENEQEKEHSGKNGNLLDDRQEGDLKKESCRRSLFYWLFHKKVQ